MNLLRKPPFPLTVGYDGLDPDTPYAVVVYNTHAEAIFMQEVVSDAEGSIVVELSEHFSKYDGAYSLHVYEVTEDPTINDAVIIDTLYIYRPYFGADEDMTHAELLARHIIDSITGGFYYTVQLQETTGMGADFLPVHGRLCKVNYLYENNVLIYDRFDTESNQDIYIPSPDHTAITKYVDKGDYPPQGNPPSPITRYDRKQSKPVKTYVAKSDSVPHYGMYYTYSPVSNYKDMSEYDTIGFFPQDWDYVVVGEFGWTVVPNDIRHATEILIDDIICNRFNHGQRYISEYQTDQFRVKYNSQLLVTGTGNVQVDRILAGYTNSGTLGRAKVL